MFPSASSPTSFQAGVSRESLSTRDAYLAKLNKNQMIAQNQNNKVANIQ